MFICYHLQFSYIFSLVFAAWFLLSNYFTVFLMTRDPLIFVFLCTLVFPSLTWYRLAGFFVLYTFTLLKLLLVFGSCCTVSIFSVLSLSWIYQLEYLQDNYCTHWPYQVFIIHYLHILTRDSFTHPLVFPSLTRYWLTVFYFFL